MTFTEQLEYVWERGYYSVVKNCDGKYYIFSTKATDGRFRMSCLYDSVAAAKLHIGETTGWDNNDYYALKYELKIVDTIHPSELMGKGFQVGDKVRCVDGSHLDSRIFTVEKVNTFGRYTLENVNGEMLHRELKPVLPVEDEVAKALAILKKHGVIKDGQIVNL